MSLRASLHHSALSCLRRREGLHPSSVPPSRFITLPTGVPHLLLLSPCPHVHLHLSLPQLLCSCVTSYLHKARPPTIHLPQPLARRASYLSPGIYTVNRFSPALVVKALPFTSFISIISSTLRSILNSLREYKMFFSVSEASENVGHPMKRQSRLISNQQLDC